MKANKLESVCKSLTKGMYETFANTVLYLLKKQNSIKVLSVYHHIECSNFWDDVRVEINGVVIAYRVSYLNRFKNIITFNYMKTPDGLIVRVGKEYGAHCSWIHGFFMELVHASENDVYSLSNIDAINYTTEEEIYQYEKL